MSKDTRNIIILKNLPSNLIDEAIIVVKKNAVWGLIIPFVLFTEGWDKK